MNTCRAPKLHRLSPPAWPAERLGVKDEEMEFKAHYEQARRDGRYVLLVKAPTDERKTHATELLRTHGAHSVSFHGRFTIEALIPPRES